MKMILNKVLEILGAVLLVGMVAVVLWQVFSRTVLGNPNTVTEELVRFGLVWFAMLSSAYVVGQKAHLAVTVLSEKLSGKRSSCSKFVSGICCDDHGVWRMECCHVDNGADLAFFKHSDGVRLFVSTCLRDTHHYL